MNKVNKVTPSKSTEEIKKINKKVEEIDSTIKSVLKNLFLISKLLGAKKERELWDLQIYSDISCSISEIQEKTTLTLNHFEVCGIDWLENWSKKVKENKELISEIKKKIEEEATKN